MRPFRSLLCVPAHKPDFYAKAMRTDADALMFDLEDSVPVDKKAYALATLLALLPTRETTSKAILVRVNDHEDTYTLSKFYDAGRIDAFVTPKIDTRDEMRGMALSRRTLPVIETARAIVELEDILSDDDCLGGIFGVADYAAKMGMSDRIGAGWAHLLSPNGRFLYAKQKLATVAAAFGKQALDTSFFVRDAASNFTFDDWREVAGWGFTGGACIHPAQVTIANELFGPRPHLTKWAEQVEAGMQQSGGEVYVDTDSAVVGAPTRRQAVALLEKAQ